MSSARPLDSITVREYLEGEANSQRKHEYVCGVIYAQAGASNVHNLVASNLHGAMFSKLRGKPCRVYGADTKVRSRESTGTRVYYPDGLVVCESNPPADHFQDKPVVIFEVLSPSTRRIDEGVKGEAYKRIESLNTLVLLEQHSPAAVVFQRAGNVFERHVYQGYDASIPFPAIKCFLPLDEVYESVEFVPEPIDDDIL